ADCETGSLRASVALTLLRRRVCLTHSRRLQFAPTQDPIKTGEKMKTRTVLATLAFCLAAAAFAFGQDAQMGTWKLNDAKSKFPAGATKNNTVSYQAAGDQIKVTIDGTDASGNPMHSEWTGKFDGKDYAVTGDPSSDTRSYKKVDDHTMSFAAKKGGKVTTSGRITVAADGMSRTVNSTTTDAKG